LTVRRKGTARRRGLTRDKVLQLLGGNDYFGDAYGNGKQLDEENARADWESARVFLLPEFQKYNPGRTCWAAWKFDGADVPTGQKSFAHTSKTEILKQFPL